MKRTLLLLVNFLFALFVYAQNMDVLQVEKLQQDLQLAKADTARAFILSQLAEAYRDRVTDTSLIYAQQALDLSRRIGYPRGEAKALITLCYYFFNRGNLTQGLELGLKALDIIKKNRLGLEQPYALVRLGNVFMSLKDYRQALDYFHQSREVSQHSPDTFIYAVSYWRAADAYYNLGMYDSALAEGSRAEDIAKAMGNNFVQTGVASVLGNVFARLGNDTLALYYYHKNQGGISKASLATFFRDRGMTDSAIYYAERAYEAAVSNSIKQLELTTSVLLSSLYETKDPLKSLHYLKVAMTAKDSLYGAEKVVAATSVTFREKERENEIRAEQLAYRGKMKLYASLAVLALVIIIALLLYRNIRHQRRMNALLQQQKNEIAQSLADLKAAQAQLVQAEKMASLGQLTAGIAHEIQNPLNFVNNFSEINNELIEELKGIRRKAEGERNPLLEEELINDIGQNEEKIIHHGKRADAIVKNMLQHSRSSSGQKEPTDINALCDEYLRLAYHGMRAKDKSFTAVMNRDFDVTVGKVNVVPQDFGRVLLNLINNAFYACSARSAQSNDGKDRNAAGEREGLTANSQQLTASPYEATVSLTTKRTGNTIEIRVADNGNGIPLEILDKIFQPFFTTKPTGEGTGLGLSLSYDIVKAHGGEIRAETKEGEGSTFIVSLPLV